MTLTSEVCKGSGKAPRIVTYEGAFSKKPRGLCAWCGKEVSLTFERYGLLAHAHEPARLLEVAVSPI